MSKERNNKPVSRFRTLVNQVKTEIQEVERSTVEAMLASGESFFLLDVREKEEWDQGHIPGALHVGKGVLERDINAVTDEPDAPIVLYCGGGSRSALAAACLQRMGYTNVRSMIGGFRGWEKAGSPG